MTVESIKQVGIAGAGTMGASMAQIFAEKGYDVVVYDAFEEGLRRGQHLVEVNQESLIASGTLTEEQSDAIRARLQFVYAPMEQLAAVEAFRCCDIIVESVLEKLEVKQAFWEAVSQMVKPECIMATNTSGLSIGKIAARIEDKSRFCGMHWFNPSHIVPLIEVISGDETARSTLEVVYQLALKIGKKPIYVKKDAPGFIANRLQAAILREALYIVEQGIGGYADVDGAMRGIACSLFQFKE